MSDLTRVLKEQYDKLEGERLEYGEELMTLPKGYISKKSIRGRVVYYLQYRDGSKIISKHITRSKLPEIEAQIARRKQLEENLRIISEDQNRLKKILRL